MKSGDGKRGTNTDDVAIVGMACIFPGAPDLKTYWRNIVSKVDAVSEAPDDWGADVYYDPSSSDNDRTYCRRGGYLHELASFDPLEYGVMPTSIDGGEPDHFLALRVAHEALADAGYRRDGTGPVRGDRVEVIVGRGAYINRGFTNLVQHSLIIDQTLRLLSELHPNHTKEELAQLRQELKASLPPFNPEMAPGLVPNILSGRIANRLDLMGPNFTIDAACASSLIAVERAMQDLLAGRCDMALTGGIHCSSPPPIFMVFCQLNALSRRGKIQPFAEEADGTLLGEGLGLIVLKRTADAQRDGDRIYAVIKAVGSASDGRALGLLAPRVEGEELAIRRAYEACGVSPSSIGLLEAHGTGTPVGDQTEAQALARVFGARNGRPPFCALGSVKSMISHLIPAAGIAGIIKVALALHYKVLPPTLHCERPNQKLGLDQTPLYLNTATRPWIHGLATPRRAGVNAFGFGGINAHAILQEVTPKEHALVPDGGPPWDSEVVILRAASRGLLIGVCKRLEDFLTRTGSPSLPLCDLAYSLNCEKDPTTEAGVCLAIVASSTEDLARKLTHSATRLADPACRYIKDISGIYFFERMLAPEGKLAFLFPGEGSQYLNMFADLCMRVPPVRAQFDLMDAAFSGHARESLPSQVIFPPPSPNDAETRQAQERRLEEMDCASEAVFAASQGMLALLAELEILPDVVVGHSGGEISALLTAGVIQVASPAEIIRHITDINQLYLQLSAEGLVPSGCAFAVSGVDREAVVRLICESGGHFDIGMDNCPHQVVVCGTECSADGLLERLRSMGALCTPMPFQRPYHTPAFEPYCARIRPFFDRVQIGRGRVPAYSAATTRPFPDDPEEIRRLAAGQTALPVRFRETLEALHDDGARVFVEVGPKGILTSFVADTLRTRPHAAIASDLPQVSGTLQLNHMLAHLAAQGVRVRLNPLYERREAQKIDLDDPVASKKETKRGLRLVTSLPHLRLKDHLRARKATEHAATAPSEVSAQETAPVPSQVAVSHVPDPVAAVSSLHFATSERELQHDSSSPMHAYLTSMDRFLTVQQEVMQAYLSPSRTSVAVVHRTGEAAIPTNGNGAKPSSKESPMQPVSGSDNKDNGHVSVLAMLLEVITERTGYPSDMLAPALNLEADLGIDSIKRIEILGALHRRTGLIGPEQMEHVSSLKTIAGIVAYLESGAQVQSTPQLAPTLPLAGRIESLEPEVRLVTVREFDTALDLFLNDHALGGSISSLDENLTGLPLIPLTMTMELMAEVASLLVAGRTLIGMRNVRGLQWLAMDRGKLKLRTIAERRPYQSDSEVRIEVRMDGDEVLVADGIAIFGDKYPDPPDPPPLILRSGRPSEWTTERLYRDHMFHGPCFRGIELIHEWGENGSSATLVSLPVSGLFQSLAAPEFLTDPVLLDAAGQIIGYWAAEHLTRRFNVFPYRIESLQIYGRQLPERCRAECRANIRLVGESRIDADLDVIDSGGRLLARINGWEDLRVDLPDSFYRMCISTRGVFLSSVQSIDARAKLCTLEMTTLPSLTAYGGIWLRVLAHILLCPRERQTWHELAGRDERRVDWLLGRCCAKDAVRLLAQEHGQTELLPSDVEISADENGRPLVAVGSIRPAISISHADGIAIAAATLEPGTAIGVDVQRLDPSRDGFEDLAFDAQERSLLAIRDPEQRREYALRFWCAKEAAAKALGYGLLGGPGSVIVRSFNADDGSILLAATGSLAEQFARDEPLAVHTFRQKDLVIATCLHRISRGAYDPR